MRRLLVVTAAVAGLALIWAPVSAGPLAVEDRQQVSGASPFGPGGTCGDVAAGGVLFVDSEVEPYVDVNPTDPSNLIAVWQQDRWSNGGARGNVAGVSHDGGASWSVVPFPDVTTCPGGDFDRASDPWVSFGPDGTAYAMHLVTDAAPPAGKPGGFGDNGMMVQTSTDGGTTWSTPVLLASSAAGGDLHDKNSITADPTRPGYAYAVWDLLDLPEGAAINPQRGTFGGGLGFTGRSLVSRTTDGGLTWSAPRRLYNPGGVNQTIGNQIVVQPDGRLVDVFNEILNFRNDDRDLQFDFNLALKFSPDAGETWLPHGRPVRFGDMLPRTLFTPFPFVGVYLPDATGAETLAGENAVRTADLIPEVAVDPGNGNLYVVWQDARFTLPGATSPVDIVDEIAFTMSRDGGFTWTTPVKINQTPTGLSLGRRQAFVPMVRVLDDGTVAVSHYDFRHDTDADGISATDLFVVHCHPATTACAAGPTGWEEVRVTETSFDLAQAPFANGFFLGDYVGLGTDGTDLLSVHTVTGGQGPSDEWFARVTVGP
jgi:hypothetical protein